MEMPGDKQGEVYLLSLILPGVSFAKEERFLNLCMN